VGRVIINRNSRTRRTALLLCILFIAATLLSAAFVLTHAHHVHDHHGPDGSCATCSQVMAAGAVLKTLGRAVTAAALALGLHHAVTSTSKPVLSNPVSLSPISLKVRMNH
jgi:disulfide bond formation protein DsbB